MRIAELRSPVEFQSSERIQKPDYSYEHVWSTVFPDRCKLETIGPIVYQRDQLPEPVNTHKITIRYRRNSGFKGLRAKVGDDYFTIHSYDEVEHDRVRYIELGVMAEEKNV